LIAPRLVEILKERGIENLYVLQARASELASEGKNVVVVTPTASGKTLCYNLPILNALVQDPEARALYLFPTKALAQDQLVELQPLDGGARGRRSARSLTTVTPRRTRARPSDRARTW